jgi:hypothetical protein
VLIYIKEKKKQPFLVAIEGDKNYNK